MTATDWTQIGKSLQAQNLCLYDKLNLPLGGRDERATLFACCPYAGPIATATPAKSSPNSWDVAIFIQNGSKIASLTASAVFRLFWSKCQKLIIVQTNGRVLFYDPLGKLLNTFTMGDETLAVGLLDVKQFSYANETGLAILNNAGHCFAVNSMNTTLLWRIQDVNRELPSSTLANSCCWTVLANPPKQTQMLLCAKTKFVRGIQESPAGFQQCNFLWARRDGQYLAMETNQKNSQLLLLHDAKLIQLVGIGGDSDDFHLLLRQILIKEQLTGIIKLFWCTETAFALEVEDESEPGKLSLYALDGNEGGKLSENVGQQQREETTSENNFTFSFSAPAHFFAEIDGIRVFTHHSAHLIMPLAKATKFVFGLGSKQPGANLYEAAKNLEANNHMAYEFIRSINAQMMETAIDDCLAAAGDHFDPKMQKLLLKAASMGMRRTVRPYDADKFIRIARLLRTLNALRLLGIPLTFGQLQELSPGSLLDRLVALGHWPLAIQLCKFLRLDTKGGIFKILAHWCMAMIQEYKQQQTMSAGGGGGRIEELSKRIIAQMKQYSGIGYADIAEMASRQELPELATILLELETDVGRQVTVMLKLKRLEKALQRAAQSQQPDLMGLVLRHLRNSLNGREMELLLRKVPQALSIYQSEIRDEAPDRLLALYDQNDDFIRQAILYLQRADQCQDIFDASKRMEQLAKGEKALRNMKDTANGQLVAESLQLISENVKREEKFAASLSHMSVRETFHWAAAHDELALMEQLKKQHRLADKQVFLWTVEGFSRGKKWQQLEQYLQSRKSPVGYLPVFEICASMGNKNLPLRLMDRVTDYEERVAAYLTLGEPGKAAKLAAEKTDLQMLQMIRRKYPTTSTQWEEVSKIMESIAQPR